MTFLFRGRRPKLTEAPDDLPAASPDPEPAARQIHFMSADGSEVASFAVGEARVTDLLNSDALQSPIHDVLLVLPPPRTTDPQRRLHRPRRRIEVQVGPFEVRGTMHVPPGAQAGGYLARLQPRFVPVTHATIRRPEEEGPDWFADVVLVNVGQMHGLVELGAAPAAEAPVGELETV